MYVEEESKLVISIGPYSTFTATCKAGLNLESDMSFIDAMTDSMLPRDDDGNIIELPIEEVNKLRFKAMSELVQQRIFDSLIAQRDKFDNLPANVIQTLSEIKAEPVEDEKEVKTEEPVVDS